MATIKLPRGTLAVRIAVSLIALGIAGVTVRTGLAYALAAGDPEGRGPELAVTIDPHNSDAMIAAGDARLQTVNLGPEADALRKFSRETLEQSPYAVVALRNMAMILVAEDQEPKALKYVNVATRLSQRDYLTHAWLLGYLFRNGQVAESVREADILLKQRVETWETVMPALVALTSDNRVVEPLARVLAANPEWRGTFLLKLGTANPYPDASFALFDRLKALGAPATPEELSPYFRSDAANKMPPATLYTQWRALLPANAGKSATALLRDGDFAGLKAPDPFNWRFFPGDDVYAERAQGPSTMGNALYLSFRGTRDTTFATQRLVLAPGNYVLRGRTLGDDQNADNFFKWTVRCLTPGREAILAEGGLNAQVAQFVGHELRFTIPGGCDQQLLEIDGVGGDPGSDHVAMYIDSLTLVAAP